MNSDTTHPFILPVTCWGLLLLSSTYYISSPALGLASQPATRRFDVHVWDNVLSHQSSQALHRYVQETAGKGLAHHIFYRGHRRDTSRRLTVLERVLDRILSEAGDASSAVEYWTRREWRHIEAHADVDEHGAKMGEEPRWPRHGHVLYLQVGSEVRGPTCIFGPGVASGRDLTDLGNETVVVTVPAVEGRVLRFSGDALHAVPRPADLWFLPFVQGASKFVPEEHFGRSVVLFNTWPDTEDVTEGGGTPPQEVHEHAGDVEGKYKVLVCNDKSAWTEVDIAGQDRQEAEESCTGGEAAKIWLLGDLRRRSVQQRTLKIFVEDAEGASLRETLLEETRKVTKFRIRGL